MSRSFLIWIGFVISCAISWTATAPDLMMEICDNALDDDLDGLIDLNDPDCACDVIEPVSLIPNASFEEMTCCPPNRSSLDCAVTWIQASEATTDYIHTCGWMGWENLPVPLPLPDGDACIGFRNGRFGGNETNPNWKEYTGACLTEPLRAGNTYRFEFFIGFTHPMNSPPLNVVLYGSSDCSNLPFGQGNSRHGCPLNGPGWSQLASVSASGANNWTKREFTVTPSVDIKAIAIGPDCLELTLADNPYYFLDNLILADVKEFEFVIVPENHPCSQEFTLKLPEADSLSYQWYLDGIALKDETRHQLDENIKQGNYQVLLKGRNTCKLTKKYLHTTPRSYRSIEEHICEGDLYNFYGKYISAPGIYMDTLKTIEGCDSVVELSLVGESDTLVEIRAKIFEGETYQVGTELLSQPTDDDFLLSSQYGCDSMIHLDLQYYQVFIPNSFSPNGDGINDVFTVFGGDELLMIESLQVFDRWGGKIFEQADLTPNDRRNGWDGYDRGDRGQNSVYTYVTRIRMDDNLIHTLSGSIVVFK